MLTGMFRAVVTLRVWAAEAQDLSLQGAPRKGRYKWSNLWSTLSSEVGAHPALSGA